MGQLLTAAALLLAATPAFAEDTYKCSLSNGQVQYQAQPCQIGKQAVLKAPTRPEARQAVAAPRSDASGGEHPPAANGSKQYAKADDFPLTLRGRSQPVALMLGNIASIYGRALEIDPTINAVGDFDYAGVALPTALADMATRFRLQIDLKPGLILVRRR
jgi:Domain of unknown function (DUF4124)